MEDRAEAKAFEPFPEALPGFKAAFIGVYDGHGGSMTVDYVLENLRRTVITEWRRAFFLNLGIEISQPGKAKAQMDPIPLGEERDQAEILSILVLPAAIVKAFEKVEQDIEDRWRKTGKDDGTTASIIILAHNRLFSAHVGDSRTVLARGNLDVEVSKDHKPNFPAEKERIEAGGGTVKKIGSTWRVNGNLAVARSFGDCSYKVTPVRGYFPSF